jgi:hypothetical protein
MTSQVTFAGEKIQTIVLNGNEATYNTNYSVLPTLIDTWASAIYSLNWKLLEIIKKC